jgi:hypothetical protein
MAEGETLATVACPGDDPEDLDLGHAAVSR